MAVPKGVDFSAAAHESSSVKEPASQGSAPVVDEEVQQKPVTGEAAKKKKKKKVRMALNEMQWRAAQDLAAENYMMPMAPAPYNPYWTGIQPGMEGFMPPYAGAVPYMGFGMGPLDMPFGGVILQDPFAGQGCMMPFGGPPQRDLADFGMGFNAGPPLMGREEFEARKADVKRKREIERHGEGWQLPKDRDIGREVSSSVDISLMKSKSKAVPPPSGSEHHHHRHRSERPSPDRRSWDPEPPRPLSKRKSSDYDYDYEDPKRHRSHRDEHHSEDHHYHHCDYTDDRRHPERDHHRSSHPSRAEPSFKSTSKLTTEHPAAQASSKLSLEADKKQKASVFSRISFPAEELAAASKKPMTSCSSDAAAAAASASYKSTSNGYLEDHKPTSGLRKSAGLAAVTVDNDSSDDDRHFKRRPSRYELSPLADAAAEPRGSGGRERERERERVKEKDVGGYSSKHTKI
ncbi:hypothetical protein M9H77_31511 [Catharanthus roseus]|uniref:Uncharacterized protein n=1 Tax=Catharanthus roseus TaxID=4058 RepID=A0ACC0A0N0_CATRO|nr:hypothetical protein M9H77_31511 [Catharanthus roseus]